MLKNRLIYSLLLIASLLQASSAQAQPVDRNYVLTSTPLNAGATSAITEVQYFDLLGRPSLWSTTGLGMDGATAYIPTSYDTKGHVLQEWLPGDSPTGSGDRYTTFRYDGLNRVTAMESPGQDWKDNDKAITKTYGVNGSNEVKLYTAPLCSGSLQMAGYYAAGSLHVETTTDEDGHHLSVYTDKLGRGCPCGRRPAHVAQ